MYVKGRISPLAGAQFGSGSQWAVKGPSRLPTSPCWKGEQMASSARSVRSTSEGRPTLPYRRGEGGGSGSGNKRVFVFVGAVGEAVEIAALLDPPGVAVTKHDVRAKSFSKRCPSRAEASH